MSSANKNDSEWTIDEGKSFIYKRNKRGPSMLPCGTPEITGNIEELPLLIHTYWCLLERYSRNHLHRLPTTPAFHNFSSSPDVGHCQRPFLCQGR